MAMPLLELSRLTVRYGGITALRDLDLLVHPGELVALLGANGAGKSTTLRAISALVPAAEGQILWRGGSLAGVPAHRLLKLGIGHCPEGRRVLARQSVADNLALGAWLRHDRNAIRRDLERCYSLFPRLAERRTQAAGTLSGGEQQMLAIGRGLMSEPELLIMDEPSLGLSPLLVEEMFALVRRINAEGLPVLLMEQNAVQTLAIAHRAYIIENGSVAMQGPAAELARDPELRRNYLGL